MTSFLKKRRALRSIPSAVKNALDAGRRLSRAFSKFSGSLKSNVAKDDELDCLGIEPGAGSCYDALGDYLPVIDCLPNGLFVTADDGGDAFTLGFGLELSPQTGVDDSIRASLLSLVATGLPPGSIVTVTAYASPKVEGFVAAWKNARRSGLDKVSADTRPFIERQAAARSDAFLEAAYEQPFPNAPIEVRHFRVILSVVLKGFSPEDDEAQQKALAIRSAMVSILTQSALFSHVWHRDDWLAFASELLNPAQVRAGAWLPKKANFLDELRSQVMSRGTTAFVHKDGIDFDYSGPALHADEDGSRRTEDPSKHRVTVTALTAESYMSPISLASTAAILGEAGRGGAQIPCPFCLITVLEIPDEGAERSNFTLRQNRCRQMASTPLGQISGYYSEQLAEFALAKESFSEGGIARMTQILLLLAPADMVKACVHAAAAIGRRAGVIFEPALAMHMQNLFMAVPLCATPALMREAAMMKTFPRRTVPAAVSAFPVKTESTGTGRRYGTGELCPQLIGVGRKGQIALFDLFANQSGGFSATVVGKPGSGKSVVLNEFALANVAAGGVTRVIDVGRSYEKICALMGGQFLQFSDAEVWDLNPFRFVTIESCLSNFPKGSGGSEAKISRSSLMAEMAENLERVRDIVRELMTANGLTDLENTLLSEAVARVAWRAFEENRVGTLDELYEELIHAKTPTGEPERRALDLAAMLAPYVKGASLAKWFDGTGKRIDFSNRFMVLELEGLSGMKRLRAAVLMSLMLAFRHEMERLPLEQTKLVVIDEAWDLMAEGSAGAFIESGYRRARKHNGSFVTATQSVADYLKSDTARAA